MVLSLKLQYKNIFRRVSLSEDNTSLSNLVQVARELYANALPADFNFQYKDEDGDHITVSSDRELGEAFRLCGEKQTVHLIIVASRSKSSSSKSPSASPVLDTLDRFAKEAEKELSNAYDFLAPHVQQLQQHIKDFLEIGDKKAKTLPSSTDAKPATVPSKPAPAPAPAPKPVLHFRVMCDGCKQNPIQGPRFKCLDCPNYDLCERCKDKEGPHQHSTHKFSKIDRPVAPHCIARIHQCPRRIALAKKIIQTSNNNNIKKIDTTNNNTPATNPGQGPSLPIPFVVPLTPLPFPAQKQQQAEQPKDETVNQQPEQAPVHIPVTTPLIPLNFLTKKAEEKQVQEECPKQQEEPQPEQPPKVEPETTTVPLIPLRKVQVKENVSVAVPAPLPVPVEEAPTQPAEQQPVQEEKELSPFERKLQQLEEMGFANRSRNLEVLVKHRGDLVLSIKDLLEDLY